MVFNQIIECNVCNTKIRLRTQIGYFDIPFSFRCPKCSVPINGKVKIDNENISFSFEVENARLTKFEKKDLECYLVELSAEFPTRKNHIPDTREMEMTPYLRNSEFYRNRNDANDFTSAAANFARFIKNDWNRIKALFELLWSGQTVFLYQKLQEEICKYKHLTISSIHSDLNAVMALHQILLTCSSISYLLEPGSFDVYMELSKLMFSGNRILQIATYLDDIYYNFNQIEKKAFVVIDAFVKIYEPLIPVIALRNANCLENVNREEFGISASNFEEMTTFYAASYEWILDNIDFIIALNNIFIRLDYKECINRKKMHDVLNCVSKYKKLDFIDNEEPFSKPTYVLKNKIRNAIQHFDCEVDYNSQKITYVDKHAGKSHVEEMYIFDFASLCLENFTFVFYVLEVIYNLRKILLISKSKLTDIQHENELHPQESPKHKPERNYPCPCGSGLKYKRCCGTTH